MPDRRIADSGDTMKIAHLLPASAIFPLGKHNGRYEWALRLAKQQAINGHTVAIYCGGGALQYTNVILQPPKERITTGESKHARNEALIRSAFEDKSFDVFHSHFDTLGAELAHLTDKPVITTQHWFPDEKIAALLRSCRKPSVIVPLTRHMQAADIALGLTPAAVIPHGIDLNLFTYNQAVQRNGRLLYVGRITEGKGVKEAVQIAVKANASLDIVGKVNGVDEPYFESFQHDIDGHTIAFHGPKSQQEVADMMQHASGFVFSNNHPEAFGQTIIEAQACGCPVIVSDCGANRELVQEGRSGFVCRTDEEYLRAIQSLPSLDSMDCRHFAEAYSLTAMVQAYENLYKSSGQIS